MRLFFLLLAAWAGVAGALAQERGSISGFIRDADTGETLILANVVIEGSARGTATNTSGYYTLGGLAAGRYRLIYSYIGYRDQTREVDVASGQQVRLDLSLQPRVAQGEEVIVEAEVPIETERAVGVQSVSIELVESIPSAFEDDLFRSIQLLPGVKAANDLSSKLYIRGGSPDQTLILLDNTTVYNPTHFFGFFSTFNTDAIKDVRIYKGGYPAEYGGRLGAVIDIYNREGNRNRVGGSASVGLLASRVGLDGPLNIGGRPGSFMVAARRSTLEPVLAALRNSIDGVPQSFYFYDVNGRVTMDLSERDKLNVSGYAGQDKVEVPILDDAQFSLDYGNQTFSVAWSRILSQSLYGTANATFSHYFNFPLGEIAGTEFTRSNTIDDASLKADFDWRPGGPLEVKTGFWGGRFLLKLRDTFDQQESLNSRIASNYVAAYGQAVYRPTPNWIFTAGLRADYYDANGRTFDLQQEVRLSPRAQVEYKFSDRLLAQAAYGRYYQFLSLVSNEVFSGFDVWVTVGDGLEPSSSDQFVLGLKSRPVRGLSLDTEVYYRTMNDLFETIPQLQDIAGIRYRDLFRVGDGYAYGWEVLLEQRIGRLTGLLSYTLSQTRRRFPPTANYPGVNLDFETGEARFYSPKYDRLHDFNVVGTLELGRGWGLTVAGTYATGQAYTEPDAVFFQRGNNPFSNNEINGLVSEQLNGYRLPPYHRVDLGFAKKGPFFGGRYELTLQAINVYSRRNLWFYSFDFAENPIERSAVRQLPILPNLSFQVEF